MAAGENLTLFPSRARINPGAMNGAPTGVSLQGAHLCAPGWGWQPGAINAAPAGGHCRGRIYAPRVGAGAVNGVITSRARINPGAINGAPAGGSLQGAHLCAPGWGGCH